LFLRSLEVFVVCGISTGESLCRKVDYQDVPGEGALIDEFTGKTEDLRISGTNQKLCRLPRSFGDTEKWFMHRLSNQDKRRELNITPLALSAQKRRESMQTRKSSYCEYPTKLLRIFEVGDMVWEKLVKDWDPETEKTEEMEVVE
ncbi:hypothetical protein E4U58_001297, partial [Claviceps cyperi]